MFNKIFLIITLLLFGFALMTVNIADAAVGEGSPAQQFEQGGLFENNFLVFLNWLFPFMIATATILAVIMIIFAGFRWMVGAVSPPQVEEAKTMIWAALIGLTIALFSYLVLNTINPNLVNPAQRFEQQQTQ
ncbi:hypothetical protein IIA94_01380 [Patescibacteria group bacterium]|nr:hypothetical protein [Patescibacteria group bacterium]